MKKVQIFAVLLMLAGAGFLNAAASANAAGSSKVVSFKGHYSGTASLLISGSSIKIMSVTGSGSASLIGAGSLSGTGNATGSDNLCVPFKGKASIKGASGSIKFSVNAAKSTGCSSGQSGPVTVTVKGSAKVTAGTGKAKGAKGTLKFKGTLKLDDTSGFQSGSFSGSLSGKLTLVK
ncbi:MAG TPA: hypothetical protein DEV93_17795 [Chloroflexi bacterium]|jgi:hypothetical protein|nr:hypothetical protein [Chloroflexota bacterium]